MVGPAAAPKIYIGAVTETGFGGDAVDLVVARRVLVSRERLVLRLPVHLLGLGTCVKRERC